MKTFLKYFFGTLLIIVVLFFALSYAFEYRPDPIEAATCSATASADTGYSTGVPDILPERIRIMSWNIGYAGLGDNMDFCVDGGEKVRDSKERTEQNLNDIIAQLQQQDADIYLLQEVDVKSHRTYGINQVEAIAKAFPEHYAYFAPNFKVWFVPSPLKEPIGSVHSGLVILTRIKPLAVRRIQYPSSFSWPVCMFNLKRCLLEADFKTPEGTIVHIGNTHNTAFDTGGMRMAEDEFLKSRIAAQAAKGELFLIAGDWNQCPPQYKPTTRELENKFFSPEILDTIGISKFAQIQCDTLRRSMRYNDRLYDAETSTKSVLDFFLLSKDGIIPADMKIIDLDFHSSDHNPIILDALF